MQITEFQLRQNIQHLLKEEVYGKIATVYHGSTQPPEKFIKLFENESGLVGWETGKGAGSLYGHGLYTVWKNTGHTTFRGFYGDWIYKFKINLEGFIILNDKVCKKVYGKSLTPLQQLEKIGKKQLINKFNEKTKNLFSQELEVGDKTTGNLAASISKHVAGSVNGIAFLGDQDGPVVVAYDPNIVTPLGYAKLEDAKKDIWTKWDSDKIKNSLSRAAQGGSFADAKRLQIPMNQTILSFDKIEKMSDDKIKKYFKNRGSDDSLRFKALNHKDNIDHIENKNFQRRLLLIFSDLKDYKYLPANSKKSSPEILIKLADDESYGIRKGVAGNDSTPPEALIKLADDKDNSVRNAVAGNKSAPSETLIKLADDKDNSVRNAVAENKSTPSEALVKLADDKDKKIREKVANNESSPKEALIKLINDEDAYIKRAVIENSSCPQEILMKLVDSENSDFRRLVAKHKSADIKILLKLADDKDDDVRAAVAFNDSTPPEALIKLADDKSNRVKRSLASNRSTPIKILKILSNNEDDMISWIAKENLKSRDTKESLLRRIIRDVYNTL